MSDPQIENRDQEVISKFRSVVYDKERQKKKKKIRAGLTGGFLAVCCVGLLAVFLYFGGEKDADTARYYSDRIALDTIDNSNPPSPSTEGTLPVETGQASRAPANDKNLDGGPIKTIAVPAYPDKKTPTNNISLAKASDKPLKSLTEETPVEPKRAPDPREGIRIERLVPCLKVENRQYISPQTEFSIEKDGQPDVWVWMDVRSEKMELPYTLRHVYFFNNRRHASVTLNIKYPRMRTWSNITLENDKYAGKWRAEVLTEDGRKLSQAEFNVKP